MSNIKYVGKVERGTFVNSQTGKEQSRLVAVGNGVGHKSGLNFYPDFDIKAGEKVALFIQDNQPVAEPVAQAPAQTATTS
ncbi:MAG: hypothetical protein VX483_06475 [Candidatus Thermoplasmatota archaeon]|nr:hypothetical protein [Candidatus Thermoplasmatota archaeon]